LCNAVVAVDDGDNKSKTIEIDSPTTLNALANATWPGRCQTLVSSSQDDITISSGDLTDVHFYLDGAHTTQSLEATVDWFRSKTISTSRSNSSGEKKRPPILVFNCSHERNPVELLELFLQLKEESTSSSPLFFRVYFAKSDSSRPSPVAKASAESLLAERGILVRDDLLSSLNLPPSSETANAATRTWQETLAIVWKHIATKPIQTKSPSDDNNKTSVAIDDHIRCNLNAVQVLKEISTLIQEEAQGVDEASQTTRVFVTGSLYLVGSFLTALGWNEESSPPL